MVDVQLATGSEQRGESTGSVVSACVEGGVHGESFGSEALACETGGGILRRPGVAVEPSATRVSWKDEGRCVRTVAPSRHDPHSGLDGRWRHTSELRRLAWDHAHSLQLVESLADTVHKSDDRGYHWVDTLKYIALQKASGAPVVLDDLD
jgi:hypothetical protein